MEPAEIGKNLHSLILENSHDFSPHYSRFEKEFLDWFNQFEGLKTDVRLNLATKGSAEIVKLSALLSDFTSLFPFHKNHFLYTFNPEAKDRNITGSSDYLDHIKKELPESQLFGGYASISEDYLEETFEQLMPLIEAGKLLIRPEKIIFAVEFNNDNRAMIHPANANGLFGEWQATSENQNSYPIFDRKSSVEKHTQISEILMPFLSGISIPDFTKVILDEADLLSSFRLQVKSYMKLLGENDLSSVEFRQDIIKPKLDLLNRRFKTVANMHKLKVAGTTLGAVSLGLLSISQTGLLASMSQFISFGLGTVGFVKNETEYQSAIESLKDTPEFLLWKINKSVKV